MASISHALAWAQSSGQDRIDGQLLLLHTLGFYLPRQNQGRAWLLAHGDDELPRLEFARFETLVQRRAAGEPLAYITGHKEFFGLDLHVDARVLIPRPDTEILVEWALELLAGPISTRFSAPLAVLDLGTGSGAIALALKHQKPEIQIDAIDASADALEVAHANACRLALQIGFSQGSWLDGVTRNYHCIVSNPPYVAAHDPHLAELAFEPMTALESGPDGLQDIRQIVRAASARLHPGGWLLVEHGFDQGASVRALFTAADYEAVETRRDLAGHERCTAGRASGTIPKVEHLPLSTKP